MEASLILKRSFPGSFDDLMVLGTHFSFFLKNHGWCEKRSQNTIFTKTLWFQSLEYHKSPLNGALRHCVALNTICNVPEY